MTNDEIVMPKEFPSPNSERESPAPDASLGIRASSFFRHLSFGFRHFPGPPYVGSRKVMHDLIFSVRPWLKHKGSSLLPLLALARLRCRTPGAGTPDS